MPGALLSTVGLRPLLEQHWQSSASFILTRTKKVCNSVYRRAFHAHMNDDALWYTNVAVGVAACVASATCLSPHTLHLYRPVGSFATAETTEVTATSVPALVSVSFAFAFAGDVAFPSYEAPFNAALAFGVLASLGHGAVNTMCVAVVGTAVAQHASSVWSKTLLWSASALPVLFVCVACNACWHPAQAALGAVWLLYQTYATCTRTFALACSVAQRVSLLLCHVALLNKTDAGQTMYRDVLFCGIMVPLSLFIIYALTETEKANKGFKKTVDVPAAPYTTSSSKQRPKPAKKTQSAITFTV